MAVIGACCLALVLIFPPEQGGLEALLPPPDPGVSQEVSQEVAQEVTQEAVPAPARDMWAPPDAAINAVKAALPACVAANGAGEVRLMFTVTLGPTGRSRHVTAGDADLTGIAQGCVDDALRAAPWPAREGAMDVVFGFAGSP
jgi:hypothetical protein